MRDIGKDIQKSIAVTEEVEAAFKFIEAGLINIKSQKFALLNNHVSLQLLSSGFERLLKILILLKEKHLNNEFPSTEAAYKHFKQYSNGHGIDKLLAELVKYSDSVEEMRVIPMLIDDMRYLKTNKEFKDFIEIITTFAISQRYFYIDSIILDKTNENSNPFELFKSFIYEFNAGVDTTNLSYEQEDELAIKNAIICIEKGVTAISRFFTHGLGSLGRQYYGDFSNFILLKDKDLGTLKYAEKKVPVQDTYQPMDRFSPIFLKLQAFSKSKTLHSSDYPDWPFLVKTVKVYFTGRRFYFAKIGTKVFALTGATSSHYEIPTYFKSDKLKPKQYALYLLDEAKKLNPQEPFM
jgi:hypothetical protein